MSESESDPMNSTVNTREIPRMYIPPERAKSNPNILGFSMHFSSRPLPGLGGGGACLYPIMPAKISEFVKIFKVSSFMKH